MNHIVLDFQLRLLQHPSYANLINNKKKRWMNISIDGNFLPTASGSFTFDGISNERPFGLLADIFNPPNIVLTYSS